MVDDTTTEKIRPSTPPIINWYATSLDTSPSSDSETSPPYDTINPALFRLQAYLDEKLRLGTFHRHLNKTKNFQSIEEACNAVELNFNEILNTQTIRNIEKEYQECDRLYKLGKYMPV